MFFFFKQKTAYEMRLSDWSSDVCSSDLNRLYAVLMAKIAYIGLGIMGAPMAGHLVRAGHDVTVFNRSMAKTRAWVEKHGGEAAVSPAQAAQEADIVISCVGTDDDLTAITLGQGNGRAWGGEKVGQ